MAPTYTSVVLAKRPKDDIVAGETFKVVSDNPAPSADSLKDGQVLFETNYLSIDPAMRGWLNDTRSYIPPVRIGEVMRGYAVGTVKESKNPSFPVGSYAAGSVGWTELKVCEAKELQKAALPRGAHLTDTLSVLGGLFDLSQSRCTAPYFAPLVQCRCVLMDRADRTNTQDSLA